LRTPIVVDTHERIIDGRNRSAACVLANVEPVLEVFAGNDEAILKLVVSLNVHRRHLSESQRAMIASKIATMPKGGIVGNQNAAKQKTNSSIELLDSVSEGVTQKAAADALNVSVPSVKRANVVHRHGTERLKEAVVNGDVSVKKASEIARLPEAEQEKALTEKPSSRIASAPQAQAPVKSRGVGVRLAHEAIACLKKIPVNDALRLDGMKIVKNWIKENGGV